MGRAAASLALAAVVLATACTVLSGIDDLEKGKSADAGPDATPVGLPPEGGTPTSPPPVPPTPPPATTVTNTCGALGDWSACSTDATDVSSCAQRCARLGKSCVESCCAYDTTGVSYVGDAGLAYAYTQECAQQDEPTEALLGTCVDPTTPGTSTSVRCCCR